MSARFPTCFPTRRARRGRRARCTVILTPTRTSICRPGFGIGKTTATFYVENLGNSSAVVYIHPEAFVDSRYAILRPRTFGVRLGYQF